MAEEASAPSSGGGSAKLVIIIVFGAILLVLASMGGIFFLLKSMGMLNPPGAASAQISASEQANKDKPPLYHPFEPAFVVNFQDRGRTRYLQISVQVMTREEEVVKSLETHMPLIRNDLLMLFSGQTSETLYSAEGKESLRQSALEVVKRILEEQTGKKDAVEALYFTSFVTQ
ncbi:MAG: flagellar basal body-associated FliL family protein [Gammaproteobacteria bacterium]|nr:flagellar basal body-associated FliL family protein [Gammaproteobacteria bacterium]